MNTRNWRFLFLLSALLSFQPEPGAGADVKANRTSILLIGGAKSHGPGEHDFPNGIRKLKELLSASPDFKTLPRITIDAYPDAWPAEAALDKALTIVCYFDGVENQPLLDAKRRESFASAMKAGAGLVALHQASTLPAADQSVDLPIWLGGARYGMYDRTTEAARFTPAAHAVTRGVAPFEYRDEFYPTLRFARGAGRLTPILTPQLHIQFQDGKNIANAPPTTSTVAWAFERAGGGRSFGFTGLHYLDALDQPELRKILLNAIFWTAGFTAPKEGVGTLPPDSQRNRSVPKR